MDEQNKNDSERARRSKSKLQRAAEFDANFDKDQPSWLHGSDRQTARQPGQGLRRKPQVNSILEGRAEPDTEGKGEEGRDGPQATMLPGLGKDPKRKQRVNH